MALSWRRGPHLQPTPPSVSSVLLAPSLPLSLFKPPPVRDLYDPEPCLASKTFHALAHSPVSQSRAVSPSRAYSAFQPDWDNTLSFPASSSVITWLPAGCLPPQPPASLLPWLNCPYLWFGSNAVSFRNPRLSSGDRCWVCSCKGDALLSPTPREVFP